MSLGSRFDAWVVRGPFTALDLGLFRILYAASALLLLPRPEALSQMPAYLWRPPPGPFQLLDSPPPHAVLVGVTALEVVALSLVLIGLFTTVSSLAAAGLFVVADGLANGYGSIYHYVLLAVVPLTLCWAGWGRRLSVDARRGRRRDDTVPQWPLRLLALCTGVAFSTAGIAKLRAGWLDTDTQSTRAHFVSGYLTQGNDHLLAPLVGRIDHLWFWELLDWGTVALELFVLVAVVSWTWFSRTLPVVIAFHVAVLLVLNIAFAANVVAYGAFVRWGRWWPAERTAARARPVEPRPLEILAIAAGAAMLALGVALALTPPVELAVKSCFVLAAGAVTVVLCLRRRRPTTTSG